MVVVWERSISWVRLLWDRGVKVSLRVYGAITVLLHLGSMLLIAEFAVTKIAFMS